MDECPLQLVFFGPEDEIADKWRWRDLEWGAECVWTERPIPHPYVPRARQQRDARCGYIMSLIWNVMS